MRYVLGYVSVLVTILNEEEKVRYNTVGLNVNFKFKGLSWLLGNNVLVIMLTWIEKLIGRIIETCFQIFRL